MKVVEILVNMNAELNCTNKVIFLSLGYTITNYGIFMCCRMDGQPSWNAVPGQIMTACVFCFTKAPKLP